MDFHRQQPNTLLSGKSVFMPASITLSDLSWSTPDGRPVLSNLDLSFGSERSGLVGRNGVGKSTLLQADRRRSAAAVRRGVDHRHARHAAPERPGRSARNGGGPVRHDRGARAAAPRRTRRRRCRRTRPRRLGARGPHEGRARPARPARPDPKRCCRRCRADNARGWGWQRWSSASPTSSCWTSPPTISTATGGGQSSTYWPTGAAARSSSATTASCSRRWTRSSSSAGSAPRATAATSAIIASARRSSWRQREHDLADAERRVAEVAERAQATAERKARKDRVGHKKRARGDIPRIQLEHAAQPQRSHRRQECPAGRTPARTGPRRCRAARANASRCCSR